MGSGPSNLLEPPLSEHPTADEALAPITKWVSGYYWCNVLVAFRGYVDRFEPPLEGFIAEHAAWREVKQHAHESQFELVVRHEDLVVDSLSRLRSDLPNAVKTLRSFLDHWPSQVARELVDYGNTLVQYLPQLATAQREDLSQFRLTTDHEAYLEQLLARSTRPIKASVAEVSAATQEFIMVVDREGFLEKGLKLNRGSYLGAIIGQAVFPVPVLGLLVGGVIGHWLGSTPREEIINKCAPMVHEIAKYHDSVVGALVNDAHRVMEAIEQSVSRVLSVVGRAASRIGSARSENVWLAATAVASTGPIPPPADPSEGNRQREIYAWLQQLRGRKQHGRLE